MRAAVLDGAGRIAPAIWARPAAGPGELLLRLRGCGLCGSDIAKIVESSTRAPSVLGHEVVGDVVEAGTGVNGFGHGDRVVAAHHVPCGRCHYCRRASESMCREFKLSNLDPGGFAEPIEMRDHRHLVWQTAVEATKSHCLRSADGGAKISRRDLHVHVAPMQAVMSKGGFHHRDSGVAGRTLRHGADQFVQEILFRGHGGAVSYLSSGSFSPSAFL